MKLSNEDGEIRGKFFAEKISEMICEVVSDYRHSDEISCWEVIDLIREIEKEFGYNWPASSSEKTHHHWAGGYFEHVFQVMSISASIFEDLSKNSTLDFSLSDLLIAAYVHDLDKLERYEVDETSPTGFRKKKYKNCNETAHVLQICSHFNFILTMEQVHAITFHHGGWSVDKAYDGLSQMATILHSADLLSANVYGQTLMPVIDWRDDEEPELDEEP